MDEQKTARRPKVVIIGGGFAGINLAKKLKDKPVDVLLLDKHNYHTFQPLLYQVAMGYIEADSIAFPLRRIFAKQKNFTFNLAEVQKINTDKNTISTNIGEIAYDYLVIATGADTNFFGNKQIEHFAMPMKNVGEALNIRSFMLQNLEKAVIETDPAEKDALLTFVVVGGGPTGVELSGALAEIRDHVLVDDYPTLHEDDMKVYLVEGKHAVLGAMSSVASKGASKFLEQMGVTVRTDVHVTEYDGNEIKISDGQVIKTRNVFWAAGVTGLLPDGIQQGSMFRGNRLQTDEINRVMGYENIFSIGDVSAMITDKYPNGLPGMAQPAIQTGQHLAKNIMHLVNKEPTEPFKYFDKGSLATIGQNKAVADIGKLHFHGFVAWILWMFVHLTSLVGFTNKLSVLGNWMLKYLTHNTDDRLIVRFFDTKTRMADPETR
ncbi:MAG TPA: NAD(P)/FAD-dependent oxidoreductase [Mucilaginibacter sp.]|jgi:NADH dehydrogenase|nr:NAD(P)/FAD-dependent oxidoreductase [Mucilaginibacter sp.]